jgi:L,D-peptidoglycan transpeptidase YkuD (ErfK/YbiS/YcfS/YnhG family)
MTPAYNHFVAINYNENPAISGRGSAIFLHQETGFPTAGCVAIAAPALATILAWLQPHLHPEIVISTSSTLARW